MIIKNCILGIAFLVAMAFTVGVALFFNYLVTHEPPKHEEQR